MKLTLDISEALLQQVGEDTIRQQIDALLEQLERQAATDAVEIPEAVQKEILHRLENLDPAKCKPIEEFMEELEKRYD